MKGWSWRGRDRDHRGRDRGRHRDGPPPSPPGAAAPGRYDDIEGHPLRGLPSPVREAAARGAHRALFALDIAPQLAEQVGDSVLVSVLPELRLWLAGLPQLRAWLAGGEGLTGEDTS